MKFFYKTTLIAIIFVFIIFAYLFFSEIRESRENIDIPREYLLKSGNVIITVDEFEKALELKKSAYHSTLKDNPNEYNMFVIELVNQLSEELSLRNYADKKSILISKKDFQEAEINFKKDYPEDSFKKMLIKNGITYSFWKKQFIIKLLINRLIKEEIQKKIQITPHEITIYYDQYKNEKKGRKKEKINEKELIAHLRREKTEKKYLLWIKDIIENNPVKINQNKLLNFFIKLP
ncbi:MAG: hypothetical protein B6I26_06395 [Desulfobacteraceae bacterium 4572_130]|nr:MAG: hypothetical protein B6I26_06395 [Desulfobacteraceae bacterium 4572_130]